LNFRSDEILNAQNHSMKVFFALVFATMPLIGFSQSDFVKAEKLFQLEHYSEAKILFESVVKQNPNHAKALEYLGDIAGINRLWDSAMNYYGRLKTLNPKEANYYYKYGGCLGMKAKEANKLKALTMIGDIKGSFEKAIQLNPNHIEARWALIELYLQLPGVVGGSERKAKAYASQLLKISPIDGYLANGHIAEYFEKYKEAESNYTKAIAIGGSITTYQALANLYKNKLNQPQKAKELMETFNKKG
jgi:tetratricopeptide (TPR) repeat protein